MDQEPQTPHVEIELMVFLPNLIHFWCCPSPHPSTRATQPFLMAPLHGGLRLLALSTSTLLHQCHLIPEPVTCLQHFHLHKIMPLI